MSPPRALVSLIAVGALAAPAGTVPATGAPPGDGPERADALVPVLVTLRAQAPSGARGGGPGDLIRSLRRAAGRSQPALLSRLPRPARRLWLVNAVALRARPAEIRRIARDPAVARIEYDRRVRLFGPAERADPETPPGLFGRGDWGLSAIGAPAVWRDYGLDGRGVRVGSIDTGVDAGHPDLAGKVVAWRDFAHGRPTPYDDNGHGTHTIGTMVGGDAGGAPIGVAPGARVVVAKALDRYGDATLSTLMAAAQWIADPDGNPSTADHPTVVNASWGAPGPAGAALRPLVRRWRELGIVPVFASGNLGPGGSVAVPAAYPETLAVGALGPRGRVAPFSSRGPTVGDRAGSMWPGREMRKPDLAAPGVEVVSSVPGGAWASLSGTSMAAPHVAGAIALLRQARPALSAGAVERILGRTARGVAPAAPYRGSGAGGLDAHAAVAAVLGARAPRPGVSLIAVPPVVTNHDVLTFAVEGGGARLGVWIDGARAPYAGAGPLVRARVGTQGRHKVAIAALDPRGAAIGARRRVFRVTIDRERPRLGLVVRREGLLAIGYRARAADAVAGVAGGSLSVRVSESPNRRGVPAGRHTFAGRGPYWVEAEVADRAGNVRRVRRALSWPPAPLARRLAWNEAFSSMHVPFLIARLHRRFDGRYRGAPGLARLLAANWQFTPFVPVATPATRPPRGAIGVWSDGRRRVFLSIETAGRRYFVEDRDGRLRRGVLCPPA